VIYQTLDEPVGKNELQGRSDIPQTLEEFMTEMKKGGYDAKTFAVKLREMVKFSYSFQIEENYFNAFITVVQAEFSINYKAKHFLGNPYGAKDQDGQNPRISISTCSIKQHTKTTSLPFLDFGQ